MSPAATPTLPPRRRGAAATRALTLRVTAATVAAGLALTGFLAGRMALGQDTAIGGGGNASGVAHSPNDGGAVPAPWGGEDDDGYYQQQQQAPSPPPVVTRTS